MENSFIVIIFHIINALLCFSSNKQSFCEHKRLIKKKNLTDPKHLKVLHLKGKLHKHILGKDTFCTQVTGKINPHRVKLFIILK